MLTAAETAIRQLLKYTALTVNLMAIGHS